MESLKMFFNCSGFFSSARFRGIFRIKSICFIFLTVTAVSFCGREDVLQRVKDYNMASIPLEVVSVSPSAGAVNVSTASVISAVFSDDIDMSTVTSSTFTVNGGAVTGSCSYDPLLRTVTFTPSADMAYNTLHTVNIVAGIKSASGDSMASDYTWSFTTAAQYFMSVLSVSPASGSSGVLKTSVISAVFSDDIDMSTVTSSTFTVNDVTVPAAPVPVPGSYLYDPLLKTVTFTPSANLSYLAPYQVSLTTGIKSTAGDTLSADYSWMFTAAAQYFISVVYVSPEDGSAEAADDCVISVVFSDDIDMSTVTSSTFTVNGGAVTGSFSYNAALKTVTFTPGSALAYGTLHTVTLTQGIKSPAGDYLVSDYTWSFTTEAYIAVSSVFPSNGAVAVPVATDIFSFFSCRIDMSTVTSSTFTVNNVTVPASPVTVTGSYSYDPLLKIVKFTPDSLLQNNTPYEVKLTTGIRSTAGDYLLSDYTFSFITAPILYINVVSVFPLNGASGVPAGTTVEAVFDDNINMGTVNASTFIVNDITVPATPVAVAGVYSYDSFTRTVIFTPSADLNPLTPYEVTLTTGITNNYGDSLASSYVWTFTAAAVSTPAIYVLSPMGTDFGTGKTYDFGSLVNPLTRSAVFTIGNSGTAILNITDVSVSNDNYSTSLVPSSIAANGSALFSIVFQPDAVPGIKTANLIITNNDPLIPSFKIKLTGESTATPQPEIQITHNGIVLTDGFSTVDFGTIALSGGTASEPLVIYNIGSADLVITNAVFGGTNPALFTTDLGPFPVTVAANATRNFNIIFTSGGVSVNARAEIEIQSNDTDEPAFNIKLKGRVK